MKFDEIVRLFADKDWFDFEMVLLMSGEDAACIHTELYRWRQGGKLIELRRGLFTLAEPWRRGSLSGAEGAGLAAALAAAIYPPSYLSGRWVLERCGLIAARADGSAPPSGMGAALADGAAPPEFTCVTARPARIFENFFGRYSYATFPRDLLFGSRTEVIGGKRVRVAFPEKALLDFWFMEGEDWDEERIKNAGLTPGGSGDGTLDAGRLEGFAARAGRPRLARAVGAFLRASL